LRKLQRRKELFVKYPRPKNAQKPNKRRRYGLTKSERRRLSLGQSKKKKKELKKRRKIQKLASLPYSQYLKTNHWKNKRKEAYLFYGGYCFVCEATTKINTHHTTYKNKGDEPMEELCLLCEECHGDLHKLTDPKIPDWDIINEYKKEYAETNRDFES